MIIKKIIKVLGLAFINNFLSTTRFFSLKRKILNLIGFSIGENSKVVGPISIGTCAKLVVGNNCWVGMNFIVHGNGEVIIGNNCDIAPDVMFITGSHEIGSQSRRAGEGISYKISISNSCWIGARATFVGNIEIQESVIVGACSLVNKDIVTNVMVAGVPAKEIKKL